MIVINWYMLLNKYNIFLFFIYFFIQVFIAPKNDYSFISTINTLLTALIPNYLLITDYQNFINIYNYNLDQVNILYEYPSKFIISYVIFDIYYSLNPFKKDMLLHGILLSMSIFVIEYNNIQHIFCQALLMQTSTLFLNYVNKSNICGLLFVLSFFVYRIIIFPLLSYKFLITNLNDLNKEINYNHFIIIIAAFINILNFYWFKKIIYKFKKKIIEYNKIN